MSSLVSNVQRQIGRSTRKVWRKAKPKLPGPVRRTVQPVATGMARAGRNKRAGRDTLGTGLLRDRGWIPKRVTGKARSLVRQSRLR